MKIPPHAILSALLVSVFSITPNAAAESPSNHDWRAQWIGPATSPAIDLNAASWIWSDEAGVDPTRNAKPGNRFFRRQIDLDVTAKVVSATAMFTADNHFKLIVNGKSVGSGDDWQHPESIDIAEALRSGSNSIVVQGGNDPDAGSINAAAVIGKIRIEQNGRGAQEIVTDSKWESAQAADAAVWKPVRVVGNLGIAPWGEVKGGSGATPVNLWTCYRKSFNLPGKPSSAIARIAVDSKYWLWINGRLVVREGGLKRGPNPQDTYFDAVDLAPHLMKGDNQIAVLAWYFGKDGFSHKSSGKPGFLFEMDADATKVLSDSSWKTIRHPAFGAASNTPNFRLPESSVRFDGRSDLPEWMAVGFDDSTWKSPVEFGRPPTAPWNRLWERAIPQWKDFGLKDYENAAKLPKMGGGEAVSAELPHNAQVTPWLRVSATAGLMIKMGTDNTANEINAEYITREGEQEFETPAWMSGHKVIYQIPAGVKILGLKYRESGFNTELTGNFSSDNEFLNKLWKKCERTLYINMRDSFFDCPDRERAQWWGDIVIQLGQVFYTYDTRSHSLIRKCMYNLANWQRASKTMFSPIPAGNWDKELPQQMLASIGQYGFWTYYLNTGDRQTLADVYPHMKDYLSIWQTDDDGLIIHRSGENGWDWADWGNNVDIRVLDQAWYCLALEGAARTADVLGKPDDAAGYRNQRDAIIADSNKIFWDGNAYRDPGYKGATDDRAQGMAVVSGIAGPDKYPAIKAVLAKEFHASPYIEKYILEALFLMKDPAAALARQESRYKVMVNSETSTLWELFTRDGTLNHAWTGGPLTLMFQYMAGISPTSPGFGTYQIKPQLGPLNRIETGFDSVKGRIEVKIARQPGAFHLKLSSPPATRATACIPLADGGLKAVRVNGKPLWLNGRENGQVPGVKSRGEADGHACFEVDPGDWQFEAR